MAINVASIITRSRPMPPRMCIYGSGGMGKTWLGQRTVRPVFMQFERAELDDGVATFGLLKSWSEAMEGIGSLYNDEHNFGTLVVDSLDWLEPIIWAEAARRNKWASIKDADFGKGYMAATEVWREFVECMMDLNTDRGMAIMLLAHAEITRFESPDTEPYQRYQPKLHKAASALIQEHVDLLGFITARVSTVETDAGFKKKIVRGVGGGNKVIHVTERPSHLAKTRYKQYGMPDSLPVDFGEIARYMPFYNPALVKNPIDETSTVSDSASVTDAN